MGSTIHTVAPLSDSHSHTVILLHGRDSVASEFAEEFFESQATDDRTLPEIFPSIKWVFPASKMRNSARFETEMSQWFDIWSVEEPSEKKELQINGLRESIEEILSVIRSETRVIPPWRIILGGISQGCATAIHALFHGGIRLGGFVGLCGWLPFQDDIAAFSTKCTKSEALQHIRSILEDGTSNGQALPALSDLPGVTKESALNTPIFLSHSQDDEVVPIKSGTNLCNVLGNLGLDVTWKAYADGGHWINEPQGVDDIAGFLHQKLHVSV